MGSAVHVGVFEVYLCRFVWMVVQVLLLAGREVPRAIRVIDPVDYCARLSDDIALRIIQ